jgi:uncharacterized NAD(P)/FAD-binding protein YdhS
VTEPAIAIVGGGFSGSLLAAHLLGGEAGGPQIHLIEKGPAFGPGAAYSTDQPDHLLNVRAGNMSAYPDRPRDFLDWLDAHVPGAPHDPFSFAPRSVYGAYLQDRLRAAAESETARGRLTLHFAEAVGLDQVPGGFRLRFDGGPDLTVDRVVLATGNGPPTPPALPDPSALGRPAYVADPWARDALSVVRPDDPVLLIGSGLTMVDVVASLDAQGHRGGVLALSRRGLSPQPHAPGGGTPLAWEVHGREGLAQSLRRFRREARAAADWRDAFDGLRPHTQSLWKSLSEAERRRFLRHLRPWWDSHRHRMAPIIAERMAAHLASGRLRLAAGRLERLTPDGDKLVVRWRARGTPQIHSLTVGCAVNCTGPEGDPRRSPSSLIQGLLRDGLARPDSLRLGLDVDPYGRILRADGAAHRNLFGIGPITRGALWEITAVPDIRIEAHRLARQLQTGAFAPAHGEREVKPLRL